MTDTRGAARRASRSLILRRTKALVTAKQRATAADREFRGALTEALKYVSQTEIAAACGFSPQHICDMLHGRRGVSDKFALNFLAWVSTRTVF